MKISSLVERMKESATAKTFQTAKELEKRGIEVVDLGAGEPDFDTPEPIRKAACDAMNSGHTHYTPTRGLPELREAIAQKLKTENHIEATSDNVIVTPGLKQAIFETILVLVDEGDEVLIPTPAWVSYAEMVRLARGIPKEVRTDNANFMLTPEALEGNIGNKTRLMILNSPNNPTGVVYSESNIRELADIVMDHGIYVISDEIYEKILFEKEHFSIGSISGMENLSITANGFSKSYAMTGWRLGYAAGPREIISAMNKVQQHTVTCAPSFVQKAGVVALSNKSVWENYGREMVKEFKERRNFLLERFQHMRLPVRAASGAFYLFPDISRTNMNSMSFSESLMNSAGVIVVPGRAFGGYDRNVRVSYATSLENLKEASRRMEETLENLMQT